MITAERYHDISMGHRVVGHENKCRHLHGHNYRIHFVCEADQLDALGRVIDFGLINDRLCQWLEEHWDHRLMIWQEDPLLPELQRIASEDLCIVPFNPTSMSLGLNVWQVRGFDSRAAVWTRHVNARPRVASSYTLGAGKRVKQRE